MEQSTNEKIKEAYLDGVKQLADKPGNTFGMALFLTEDGDTEVIINIHTADPKALLEGMTRSLRALAKGIANKMRGDNE